MSSALLPGLTKEDDSLCVHLKWSLSRKQLFDVEIMCERPIPSRMESTDVFHQVVGTVKEVIVRLDAVCSYGWANLFC